MENKIQRIEQMEKILNDHSSKIENLKKQLSIFRESQKNYSKLSDYYSSKEYFSDLESYDRGELPENLQCGVLSEDAVFDLIGENFNLAVEMLEIATSVIKNH